MGYRFRGQCLPIDVLERVNSWTQSAGDLTPAGRDLRSERTALGIVTHRATIRGKPYAFTRNRATYYHEVDSALGFADFNNPEKMESPREFMKAACRIDYTFNWFFIDRRKIAYFNSGINPVRSKRAHPDLPTFGKPKYEWRDYVAPSQALLSGGADQRGQRRSADQLLRPGAVQGAPADRRPELAHELEQQAGARLPRLRRRVLLRSGVPLDPP